MRLPLIFTCAAACLCTAHLVSCGILSDPVYTPVYTYDVGFPPDELVRGAVAMDVSQFTCDTSARYKMSFRYDGRIEQDEYRKWAQSPASMLTKYLKLVFSADDRKTGATPLYALSGSLLSFEAEPDRHICRLYIDYTIRRIDSESVVRSGILRIETSLPDTGNRGDDFASAMSQAAEELAKSLDKIVKAIPAEAKKQ